MNQEKNNQEEFMLTRDERIRMRRVVYQYMEMKPRRAPEARTAWSFRALSPRIIASGLVVALFASSAGISLAAQNTLPGDLLYPVKVDVNEPVQGALATSASAKAAWAASVAGERVKEAAELAAEGRLSSSTQQELAANFDAHADIAIATIQQEASTSPDVGAQAAVGFQAQLNEYQQVLADVASTTNASSSPLTASIETRQTRLAGIRAQVQALLDIAGAASSTDALAASHMRTAAQAQLEQSLSLAQETSGALSASSSAQVALQLQDASGTISAGSQLLQNNAAPQALTSFQNALSAAEKLGVFLQTSSAIHDRTGLVIGQPNASSTPTRERASHHMRGTTATTTASSSTMSSSSTSTTTDSTSSPQANVEQNISSSGAQSESPVQPSVSLPISVPSLP